jgi:hypothetical protein
LRRDWRYRAMTKQHEDYRDEYAVVAGEPATAEEKAAQTAEEKLAKEAEELRGKEKVRDKVARLVGELRGGQVFGAARKAIFDELEELVRRMKGEETVGDLEKERAAEEAKAAKKAGV